MEIGFCISRENPSEVLTRMAQSAQYPVSEVDSKCSVADLWCVCWGVGGGGGGRATPLPPPPLFWTKFRRRKKLCKALGPEGSG